MAYFFREKELVAAFLWQMSLVTVLQASSIKKLRPQAPVEYSARSSDAAVGHTALRKGASEHS